MCNTNTMYHNTEPRATIGVTYTLFVVMLFILIYIY